MTLLSAIKFIFELRGALSGYKTYIGLAATMMTLTAGFLTNQVIPWMDGSVDTMAFIKGLPQFVALMTAAWTAGALRSAIGKSA
jgi:hypothetical protein